MKFTHPVFVPRTLLTFSGSFLSQIVQVGSYPILISQMLNADGWKSSQIGIFAAISWATILIGSPVVSRLINAAGYVRANWIASFLTVVGLTLVLIYPHAGIIAISAVFLGLGLIIRWINCDTVIVEISENTVRGQVVGWHEALMGLGIGVGPLLFAAFSLQTVTLVSIAIIIASQIFFILARLPSHPSEDGESETGVQLSYQVLGVALAAALIAGLIESSAVVFIPLQFEFAGYSLSSSAILVSAFGFGGTILQPGLGTIVDRFSYASAQSLCIITIVISAIAMIAYSDQWTVLVLAAFFLGGAAGGLNTLAVIEAGKTIKMTQMAVAMTAIAAAYTVGSIVGPLLSGLVLETVQNNGVLVLYALTAFILGVIILARLMFSNASAHRPLD